MAKTPKRPWDFVYDDIISNDFFHETLGIVSNGEDFLFQRTDRHGTSHLYRHLSDFLGGYPNIEYAASAENDSLLLRILNEEQADLEAATASGTPEAEARRLFITRVRARCADAFGDPMGPCLVKAIRALLTERGLPGVTFEPSTFADRNDIPWCNALEHTVDTVYLPEGDEERIGLSIAHADGFLAREEFDGTEKEDFRHLFSAVFAGTNDDSADEDEWLDAFVYSLGE